MGDDDYEFWVDVPAAELRKLALCFAGREICKPRLILQTRHPAQVGQPGTPANGAAWTTGECSLRVLRGGSFPNKAPGVTSAAFPL